MSRSCNSIASRDREIEQELIDLITLDLTARVIVYGPYQSGKTTLLRFLESRIQENGISVIFVDLSRVSDSQMFWRRMSIAFGLPIGQHQEPDVYNAIYQFDIKGPRLVILFDELQAIYANKELSIRAVALLQFMAGLRNLSYVAVGTFKLRQLLYKDERPTSPASMGYSLDSPFNKALFRRMPQLSGKEMEDLLSQYKKTWVDVPADVAAEIISESNGHAASFMILLQLFDDFVVENAKDWKRVFIANFYRYLNGLDSRLKAIIQKDVDMQYRLQHILGFGSDARWETELYDLSNPDVKMLINGILDLEDGYGQYLCRFTSRLIFRCCMDIIFERRRKPLPREKVTDLATLLYYGISEFSPKRLTSPCTQSLHGPSEACLHAETYSALKAILPENMTCFFEPRARKMDRVDLLVYDDNAYWGCIEIKVGKNSEKDMQEPYKQAKKHAEHYGVPAIIANFILDGQQAPTLQTTTNDMEKVSLINVVHSSDCRTFEASFLEAGQAKTLTITASD